MVLGKTEKKRTFLRPLKSKNHEKYIGKVGVCGRHLNPKLEK